MPASTGLLDERVAVLIGLMQIISKAYSES